MSRTEWLVGKHAVAAALDGEARCLYEVWIREGAEPRVASSLERHAARHRVPVVRVSSESMIQEVGEVAAVAARCGSYRYRDEADLPAANATGGLVVVLDRIQDPQNLGAIIRTAEAAGASALCIASRQAAAVTPAVVRASAGATEFLPIYRVVNVARVQARLADLGYWSVGLVPEAAQAWHEVDLTGAVALVVGAEGAGLRRLVAERCDHLVSLPMAGRTESLNASAAFAAMAYELVRQQAHAGTG